MTARTGACLRHWDRISFVSPDQCGTRLRRVFAARSKGCSDWRPGRSAAARRKRALATMAGLVGALILSRAVDGPHLSDEILQAPASLFGNFSDKASPAENRTLHAQ